MRAHELIASVGPDYEHYADLVSSVKFDLGRRVEQLSQASKGEFFEIPAPICLFQSDDFLYLAKEEDFGGVSWLRWQCINGAWFMYDMEFHTDSKVFFARRLSTNSLTGGEWVGDSFNNDLNKATPDEKAAIIDFMNTAAAIEVFSCCNVSTVEHLPPKFINAKRVAKGKVPFFSYRTLRITGDGAPASESGATGTHARPRLHLRRGHIRRLDDTRRIWVRASLVGDKSKGFAQKDYEVSADKLRTKRP